MGVGINTHPFSLSRIRQKSSIEQHTVITSRQTTMIFQVFRHRNPVLVEQFLLNSTLGCDPNKTLSPNQSLTSQQLQAMQKFAAMRQKAEDADMCFAATFVTPSGYHYTTTNLPGVERKDNILQYLLSVPFGERSVEGCIRLVETEDGIQLQIVEDSI